MAPKGGLSQHLRGEQCPAQYNNKTKKITEKLNPKTHPKDVVDRPSLGVRDPRGSITGWKGGRVESRADRER